MDPRVLSAASRIKALQGAGMRLTAGQLGRMPNGSPGIHPPGFRSALDPASAHIYPLRLL
jgi:hypothetical protein